MKIKEIPESELSDVAAAGNAGQAAGGYPPPLCWEYDAKNDYSYREYVPVPCPRCKVSAGGQYSMYCGHIQDSYFKSTGILYYRQVRCFACGLEAGEIDSNGNITIQ